MDNLWAPWRMDYITGEAAKKTEGCVFCEITKERNDAKNHIIYRGKSCYVVLNKFPYNNGHAMVIPFDHAADLLALEPEIQNECQLMVNKTIAALHKSLNPQGINIGLNLGTAAGAGISEHIHWHILPRWSGDTNFMPVVAGIKVISEALDETYKKLKKAFLEL